MKISRNQNQAGKGGYALLVTLTFLGIMLTVFASIMYYILSNAKLTKRNNQYVASEAAAEAATEKVLSQMNHDFQFGNLNNSSTNATYYATSFLPTTNETGWPIQYSYSGTNTSTNQQISVVFGPWASNAVPLNSQYTGLQGFEQDVTLIATATPTTGTAVPSTVTETVQFALIPLFQFAIFYNMNLEIAAAQPAWGSRVPFIPTGAFGPDPATSLFLIRFLRWDWQLIPQMILFVWAIVAAVWQPTGWPASQPPETTR